MAIQDKKFIFLSVQILRIIIDDLVKKGLDIIVFGMIKDIDLQIIKKIFGLKVIDKAERFMMFTFSFKKYTF